MSHKKYLISSRFIWQWEASFGDTEFLIGLEEVSYITISLIALHDSFITGLMWHIKQFFSLCDFQITNLIYFRHNTPFDLLCSIILPYVSNLLLSFKFFFNLLSWPRLVDLFCFFLKKAGWFSFQIKFVS